MLNNFVAVYIPGTRAGNIPLDADVKLFYVRKVASELSAKCGGASAFPVSGFWLSDTLGLIEESITVVKSYYDPATVNALDLARVIAGQLRDDLQQEAVTVESDAGIEFI